MIQTTIAEEATIYPVRIAYPAPLFVDLDDLLDQFARDAGGTWSASGVGLLDRFSQRDIEFHFTTSEKAGDFSRKCSFLFGVRILP